MLTPLLHRNLNSASDVIEPAQAAATALPFTALKKLMISPFSRARREEGFKLLLGMV